MSDDEVIEAVVMDRRWQVDEATWQRALEVGWTGEELAELLAYLIANLFTSWVGPW